MVCMETNVGDMDSKIRIGLGAVSGAVSLAILGNFVQTEAIVAPVLGVLSIALLATGFTSKCGLYKALGINTEE